MDLGPLAPPLARPASWPGEVSPTDVAWLNRQWQLAGGLPALTKEERLALAGYLTWVTTESVR